MPRRYEPTDVVPSPLADFRLDGPFNLEITDNCGAVGRRGAETWRKFKIWLNGAFGDALSPWLHMEHS